MYQQEGDSIMYVDETRWDTATPQYTFQFIFENRSNNPVWVPLYEAYFDKPAYVHDTFYVGGTTHNNLYHGATSEHLEWCWFPAHPTTNYWSFSATVAAVSLPAGVPLFNPYAKDPDPSYHIIKYYSPYFEVFPDMNNYTGAGSGMLKDTSHFIVQELPFEGVGQWNNRPIWLPFFAIFDTNFVSGVGTYTDSCVAPTGLHTELTPEGGLALAWNADGQSLWQTLMVKVGENMNNGTLKQTPINYVVVDSLEKGYWYEARVRTLCDTTVFGPWTDSVLFYIPEDTCAGPVWLHVAELDSAMVTLEWNFSEALAWEVETGVTDFGMMGGQTTTAVTNSLHLDGLYIDTWYWARVRAMCDTDFWSAWTDTVMFHVPLHHVGDTTTRVVTPVEQYTYLMPNPAREEVTVASSFRVKAVELYGADGKLLQQKEVNAVGTTLDLKGLPAGIYFVRVVTTAGMTTKRLVIE